MDEHMTWDDWLALLAILAAVLILIWLTDTPWKDVDDNPNPPR
jgi:cyanate permease